MNLLLADVPDAATVRQLMADGGKHLYDGGKPIPIPCRDPLKATRPYTRKKPYKNEGIFARLRALKVGGKPLIEPKKNQAHPGSFSQYHPSVKFKTKTLSCGKRVEIWRVE